ncbi:excalibur calcium-binding domain-containing protein [Streptomyces gobiensis]|uniref:excalibur calcium-binding domain-containing protein n=1 Tax=Streptomyces gobiensis TaxID=2875706 RepID=UPI001E2DFC24|nr:excalibur calcium-binding domain-containing protein [Streptomyces gobiensis]UGY94792.1 excalibur calcium-binding domain-containing protein [Streptomyces gobiensis]
MAPSLPRACATVVVAIAALTALPSAAHAHGDVHPFKNCTEAYDHGHSHIPKGDEHYGAHLDRDRDGIGCDSPPKGFVPAKGTEDTKDTEDAGDAKDTAPAPGKDAETELAETGGDSATPYLAGAGAAVLLAGGGVLIAARRRRASQ